MTKEPRKLHSRPIVLGTEDMGEEVAQHVERLADLVIGFLNQADPMSEPVSVQTLIGLAANLALLKAETQGQAMYRIRFMARVLAMHCGMLADVLGFDIDVEDNSAITEVERGDASLH